MTKIQGSPVQGYDYNLPRYAAEQRGYVAHIHPHGEDRDNAGSADPLKRPRRWVVERLHSWLNRSRRLLVRQEKLERTYQTFPHPAAPSSASSRVIAYERRNMVPE
jgi:putative transposase